MVSFSRPHRPDKSGYISFLNPFFGVAIAAVLLGESLTIIDIIGVAIIMVGILTVQKSKHK